MNEEETSLQIKILIVDDDKIVADILRDVISLEERVVDVCYDGLSAIERIQEDFYDLIVVDLVLPKVGGLEVLKYAKKVNPDVIVIIITGYASLETAIMAVKEGAYDYIGKPFKLEELKIVIENAVDKIRLNRENKELLRKLQEAYHELMVLKRKKVEDEKVVPINILSSNMPSLHYLFNTNSFPNNYLDKLQALSSLKESGMLTEAEFEAFKRQLLKMVNVKE